jgi:hypothetical protein
MFASLRLSFWLVLLLIFLDAECVVKEKSRRRWVPVVVPAVVVGVVVVDVPPTEVAAVALVAVDDLLVCAAVAALAALAVVTTADAKVMDVVVVGGVKVDIGMCSANGGVVLELELGWRIRERTRVMTDKKGEQATSWSGCTSLDIPLPVQYGAR